MMRCAATPAPLLAVCGSRTFCDRGELSSTSEDTTISLSFAPPADFAAAANAMAKRKNAAGSLARSSRRPGRFFLTFFLPPILIDGPD